MAAQGTSNVRVRCERVRGRKQWVVIITIAKRRQRRYFRSTNAANAEAAKIRKEILNAGAAWVAMSADERADIIAILREVKREKLNLRKVWTDYQELSRNQPGCTKPLDDAVELFLEDMKQAHRSDRYIDSLGQYLRQFIRSREQLGCDKVTKQSIDDWFRSRQEGDSTRNSNLGRLSSFFDFCYRSGWIRSNPVSLVTKIKVQTKPPGILSSEQFKRVLFVCYWKFRDFFPYLVLALICGIRPEEIEELIWSDIDLKHRTIEVNKTSAEDKRVIPLDDTMVFWLGLCRPGKPQEKIALAKATLRRRRRALMHTVRIAHIQDIMRHSCASFLFAFWQCSDPTEGVVIEKALRVLGHGQRMFFKHYREMVRPPIGLAIWTWRPRLNIPAQVIPVHTRAALAWEVRETELGRSHAEDLTEILAIEKKVGRTGFQKWLRNANAACQDATPLDWLIKGKSKRVLTLLREFQAALAS